MGQRVALTVLATVVTIGVIGCGGSKPASGLSGTGSGTGTVFDTHCVSGCGVSFHSSRHHYTVRQVEAAFAAHGVDLHTGLRQALPGFVEFQYGRRPHFVTLAIYTRRVPERIKAFRRPTGGHVRFRRRANVLAFSDPGDFAAVKSALAELR